MSNIKVEAILAEVFNERKRQDELKEAGKFEYTCADLGNWGQPFSSERCLTVLAEEFGEVARAAYENDLANLREELIQVAAVCVAWVEGLDS